MRALILIPHSKQKLKSASRIASVLKNQFGFSQVDCICSEKSAQELNSSVFDRVIPFGKGHGAFAKNLMSYLNAVFSFQKTGWDMIINMSDKKHISLLSSLIKAKHRINCKDETTIIERLKQIQSDGKNENRIISEKKDKFASLLLYNLGINERQILAILPPQGITDTPQGITDTPQGITNHLIDIIDALVKGHPERAILLLGEEPQTNKQNRLFLKYGNQAIDLCGKLSFREMTAILSKASLAITDDASYSSILHNLNVPVIHSGQSIDSIVEQSERFLYAPGSVSLS